MKTIIELINQEMKQAFVQKGFDEKYGMVTLSNRPDLCQYQCNGALAAAKQYKTAPIQIAGQIVELLKDHKAFKEITAIMPGFINITLSDAFIADYVNQMLTAENFGCEKEENPKKILIDYGGPNIAKPLHIGHMRSAIIGECIKRLLRFYGNDVTGDVHLGDWGTQMGLIIGELKRRKPELVYFDEGFTGEYPTEAPFTITELEEIYPAASEYSKTNPEFREEAKAITYALQNGHHRGYTAIWNHMLEVSVTDVQRIYKLLNVSFELWKKESDAQPYIPEMVQYLKDNNYTRISEGALVVDVKEETDTKEIPPCIILKTDGASLYNTTDLATIVERMKLFDPDEIIYITDKRQDLYFETVFRCARKTKLVKENTKLLHMGYGTMNGKDGKPFKTREGGVMRLENLIRSVNEEVAGKMADRNLDEAETQKIAAQVGLAALKYGDLSNQVSKDYVFDMERFTSFEGDTGPYILYTIVRIKSILAKYKELNKAGLDEVSVLPSVEPSEQALMLELTKFNEMLRLAYDEIAPHRICAYIYDLANAFNSFYHNTKIIAEEDGAKQASWIKLITLVQDILLTCIDILAIEAPERM